AMQIINELEPNRRGVYTGTIGYFGFNKTAKLNIAIRTMTYESGRVTIGVGGGIVADSIPEKEYEETLHKGAAMFEALQKATFIEDKSQKKAAFNSGVFETLRAYDGVPFKLHEHLERMNNSLTVLGFQKVNEQEITVAVNRSLVSNNLKSARIRITVSQGVDDDKENGQKILIETSEFERTIPDYASVMVCEEKLIHGDELRRHKTTDNLKNNSFYEKAKMLGYDEAIFIDSENHILEGTRSNIFLVKDNVVYTPKLDCGILPGITRQIVLEICAELKIQCVEKILDASELENCDELFLTNSLNEIIPVKKIGDRELPSFKFAKMILEVYQSLWRR
ncbi:MAG: aminotransferase class IV, partial [Bacteroidetes bacterium]|nr:aminotransferase class IV [Bacteroidota bacterium]